MGTYQSRKVAHKAKRDKLLGTVCCNCGRDVGSKIEYHHIVPLECGGKDIVSNLAPVCEDCHSIITYGRKRKRPNNGGRKRKVYDPQLADSVFTRYINRQITETQAKQELGTGQHIKEMFIFKEWCEKNGVNPKINYGQSGRWYKIKKAPPQPKPGRVKKGKREMSVDRGRNAGQVAGPVTVHAADDQGNFEVVRFGWVRGPEVGFLTV